MQINSLSIILQSIVLGVGIMYCSHEDREKRFGNKYKLIYIYISTCWTNRLIKKTKKVKVVTEAKHLSSPYSRKWTISPSYQLFAVGYISKLHLSQSKTKMFKNVQQNTIVFRRPIKKKRGVVVDFLGVFFLAVGVFVILYVSFFSFFLFFIFYFKENALK